jgi:DNA polymerase gamma 1
MLEMGTAYLPINKNWERYISQSDQKYRELQKEVAELLQRLANEAYNLAKDERLGYVFNIVQQVSCQL